MKSLLTATALVAAANAALYNVTIQTNYGPIQGYPAFTSAPNNNLTNWKDITVWKGIPFAASTAGENRFRAPQKASPWNSTLLASDFGPVCPSATGGFGGGGGGGPGGPGGSNSTGASGAGGPGASGGGSSYTIDEDCLNLNIWSAGKSTSERLPVIMWSYPAESTAADALFDGGGMADKGFVFVNYNYRAGSFGWLAHPELSKERLETAGVNSSGNYGMLDQFAALKWINANIAEFGGDPNHVTVMGQSAGSAATYHIVNSPLTKGLISNAIIESGLRSPYDPLASSLAENYRPLSDALQTGVSYVASLNCSTIACMRALPMESLITQFMSSSFDFTATLDFYAMPDTYINTLKNGPANDVPIITGNTKDESGASTSTNLTVAEYVASIQSQYGANSTLATTFLKLYPAANSTQADMSYNAHWRDQSLVSSWQFSQLWLAAPTRTTPFYTYYWDHAPPGQTQGAYHESEINYVLDNLYGTDLPWEAEDFVIAKKMSGYWANFARTGNPNGLAEDIGPLVQWESAKAGSQMTMQLGDGFGTQPIAAPAQVQAVEEYFGKQTPF